MTKQDGVWRWKCFGCQQGGTAVDFVARVEGLDPIKAAHRIIEGLVPASAAPQPAAPEDRKNSEDSTIKAFVDCIRAIRQHGVNPFVAQHLLGRGIRPETTERAFQAGLLATLPTNPETAAAWLDAKVGRSLMAAAGLWSKRWPAAAYRPLIFVGPGMEVAEFRVLKTDDGAPKAIQFGRQNFPLVLRPSGEVRRVVIVEGGVDLLSMMDMGEDQDTLLVGLYGTGSWRDAWAKRIAAKYPEVEWWIATDADRDGENCATRIARQLDTLSATHRRWRPFVGKDWNDALKVIAA